MKAVIALVVISVVAVFHSADAVTCYGAASLHQAYNSIAKCDATAATCPYTSESFTCTAAASCTTVTVTVADGQIANFGGTGAQVFKTPVCWAEGNFVVKYCQDPATSTPTAGPTTTTTTAAAATTTTAAPTAVITEAPTTTTTAGPTESTTTATTVTTTAQPTTTTTAAPTTTTTAAPTTTTTAAPTTTSQSTTTATTESTTTVTATTTTMAPTTSTTAGPTTTTTAGPTTTAQLPDWTGNCLEGVVPTVATCTAQAAFSTTLTLSTGETISVTVTVDTCCTTDKCNGGDDTTSTVDCFECDATNCTSKTPTNKKTCSTGCFAKSFKNDTYETGSRGCLSDLPTGEQTCGDTEKAGKCQEAGNDEECFKCCTGADCNSWVGHTALKPSSTGGNAVRFTASSLISIIPLLLVALVSC